MKKQTKSGLWFEDVGVEKAWAEVGQAVEESDVWAKDAEIVKAWYEASLAIGKDAEYCASVQHVLTEVLRGDLQAFQERIDESYLCFGTLIRNWKNAKTWMYRNTSVDRQKHSRGMTNLNQLARTLRERGRLQSVFLQMFSDARRDVEYVQSKKQKTDFNHLSSGQLVSRR